MAENPQCATRIQTYGLWMAFVSLQEKHLSYFAAEDSCLLVFALQRECPISLKNEWLFGKFSFRKVDI